MRLKIAHYSHVQSFKWVKFNELRITKTLPQLFFFFADTKL